MLYLEEEYNRPSRTDYYLMQIAVEVRRVLSKKPALIKLKHFLIRFTPSTQKSKPPTTEDISSKVAQSKSRWKRWVGLK